MIPFRWSGIQRDAHSHLTNEQRFAVERARALRAFARVRAFDPSQPRDEDGKWTSGGAGSGASEAKPAQSGKGKGKGKAKWTDFAKDGVHLDNETVIDDAKKERFVARWNDTFATAPADFRKEFLGGVENTMRIHFDERNDAVNITGTLSDANGEIGTYDRSIDLDDKQAKSSYFKLIKRAQGQGIGKKVLGGNVAVYQKLGITKLKVNAGLDRGGYAWAKYGYVPTRQSWDSLRDELLRGLGAQRSGTAARVSGNTRTPESWDEIGDDDQSSIETAWARYTYDEFQQSEENNWRESGQALEEAKGKLADNFTPDSVWARAALKEWREQRAEEGEREVPFTDEALLASIDIAGYESRYREGRDDADIEFNDDRLDKQQPTGFDPAQQTLPGIEPMRPRDFLKSETREEIVGVLVKAFNDEADTEANDMDVPDMSDQIAEYQSEYWSSMSDRQRFQWAQDNGELPEYPLDEDEKEKIEEEPAPPPPNTQREALEQLLRSDNPKAIWGVADSARGKELLSGRGWQGTLDFNDKDSMTRFWAYVRQADR